MDAEPEIERAGSAFKSLVWKHFGFVKSDKSKVICLHCKGVLKYAGNTTNMAVHLKRHHPQYSSASSSSTISSTKISPSSSSQRTLQESFKSKLVKNSPRSIAITDAITELLIDAMLPYSFIDNVKFRKLINLLEPRYTVSDRMFVCLC